MIIMDEVIKQEENKPAKEKRKEMNCPRCKWKWIPLKENPRCCPRCKKYFTPETLKLAKGEKNE